MMVPILIHWFIAELRPVFGRRNERNVPSQSMIVTTVSGAQWYGPTCSEDSHLAKMRLLRLLDIGRGSINRSSHIAFASLWYLPEGEGSFLVGFADAEEVSNAPTKRIGWLPVGKSGSDFRSRIAYKLTDHIDLRRTTGQSCQVSVSWNMMAIAIVVQRHPARSWEGVVCSGV